MRLLNYFLIYIILKLNLNFAFFIFKKFNMQNSSTNIIVFTQSQSHGLFWDSEIREKCFELPPCINDTTKYDISCENNKFDPNENISIKTSGNNNIDCGDILRFYDGDFDKKYTIILIRYKQNNNKKIIYEILEIDYNNKLRDILFGTVPKKMLEGYVNYIKNILPQKNQNN